MYLTKESNARLNAYALLPQSASAAFKVHYWGVEERLTTNLVHKHSFFEICYIVDGAGTYIDDGVKYKLNKGSHFCSRPGITHQIRTGGDLFIMFVGFELDRSRTSPATVQQFDEMAVSGIPWIGENEPGPTALLWETLLLRDQPGGVLQDTVCEQVACALLQSFPALFLSSAYAAAAPRRTSSGLLQQAKLFITDNAAAPLTLSGIAKYLNVSERHLSRLFNDGIHESFTGYVRRERVRQAAELLVATDLPVKDIAERVGFSSIHYFTRSFTREKQLPPARYRQQFRRQP